MCFAEPAAIDASKNLQHCIFCLLAALVQPLFFSSMRTCKHAFDIMVLLACAMPFPQAWPKHWIELVLNRLTQFFCTYLCLWLEWVWWLCHWTPCWCTAGNQFIEAQCNETSLKRNKWCNLQKSCCWSAPAWTHHSAPSHRKSSFLLIQLESSEHFSNIVSCPCHNEKTVHLKLAGCNASCPVPKVVAAKSCHVTDSFPPTFGTLSKFKQVSPNTFNHWSVLFNFLFCKLLDPIFLSSK